MEQYNQTTVAESSEQSLFELQVDHELSITFNDISKWAKFVGIAGFIFTGLLLLIAFLVGKIFNNLSPFNSFVGTGGAFITLVYVFIAILFFVPSLFVFNFSRKIQYAILNNDQASLNSSFASLKTRFKFVGIFYIVIFSLWVLLFLIGLFK